MEHTALIVKMVFDRWHSLNRICDNILDVVSDEQLMEEISPGKNRGIYVLGHLIGVHDAMLSMLNLGVAQHAELYQIFVAAPDRATEVIPRAGDLRALWKRQHQAINTKLENVPAEEWFDKLSSVSTEEFEKEPHRNKLSILLTRTSHLSYHAGQLALLKP